VNTLICWIIALTTVAQELALERTAVHLERHGLRKIALGDRGDRARDLGGRPQQIVDQSIDGVLHRAPAAAAPLHREPVARLALAPDDLTGALELIGHALVGDHDLVEGVGDLADQTCLVAGQTNGKVTVTHRLKRAQQLAQIDAGSAVAGAAVAASAGGRRGAAGATSDFGGLCAHACGLQKERACNWVRAASGILWQRLFRQGSSCKNYNQTGGDER
jgi:hypothetical protein